MFFLRRGIELFLDAQNVPLVRFGFVLRVLQLFFGKQLFIPQSLGANVIRFEHFCFCFPIFQVRRNAAGFCSRSFKIRSQLTVIQPGEHRAGANTIPGFRGNAGNNSVTLSRHVHLMFHDQWRGNGQCFAGCGRLDLCGLRCRNCRRKSRRCLRLRITASRSRRGCQNKRKQFVSILHDVRPHQPNQFQIRE